MSKINIKKVLKITESQYKRLIINEECDVESAIDLLKGDYNITKKGSDADNNTLINKCLSENPFIKGFYNEILKVKTVKMSVVPRGYGCYISVEPKFLPPNKDNIWVNIRSNKKIDVMYVFDKSLHSVIKTLWYQGDVDGDKYSNLKLQQPLNSNMDKVGESILDSIGVDLNNFYIGNCKSGELLNSSYKIPNQGNVMSNIIGKMKVDGNFNPNGCK
jgi:hypothetical protein